MLTSTSDLVPAHGNSMLGPALNRAYLVQNSFGPGRALFRVPMVNRVRNYRIHLLWAYQKY